MRHEALRFVAMALALALTACMSSGGSSNNLKKESAQMLKSRQLFCVVR